jgi:hypothetical protein
MSARASGIEGGVDGGEMELERKSSTEQPFLEIISVDAAHPAAGGGVNFGYFTCEPCLDFNGWWGAKTVVQKERVAYYVLLTGGGFVAFAYVASSKQISMLYLPCAEDLHPLPRSMPPAVFD